MSKPEKQFILLSYECPNCSNNLEVNTTHEQTSEFEDYVYDGDEVRCNCGFESCISVDEYGNAGVQDGNILDLIGE